MAKFLAIRLDRKQSFLVGHEDEEVCSESLGSEKVSYGPVPSRKLRESGSNGKVSCYKV